MELHPHARPRPDGAAREKWVKGRKYVYGILGDIQDLDLNYLKTLGPIQTVTQEEIFGY